MPACISLAIEIATVARWSSQSEIERHEHRLPVVKPTSPGGGQPQSYRLLGFNDWISDWLDHEHRSARRAQARQKAVDRNQPQTRSRRWWPLK